MGNDITSTIYGFAEAFNLGIISNIESGNMAEDERGWSGAEVRRVTVVYEEGRRESIILKKAQLKERMAMKTLSDQGHSNTPATFSLDLNTDEPRWMVMEDLGHNKFPMLDDLEWMPKVAKALAKIHTDNIEKEEKMPWLPHADKKYWEFITTQISVDHFERMMGENQDFSNEFGKYLPMLRERAEEFVKDMTELYHEKESLTLTHGDIQTIDGTHIYDCNGKPYIIDYGWCYYAPFYIDIATYLSFEDAGFYYNELISRGVSLSYSDFDKRLRTAYRYNGFIYLYPSIMKWASGPTERTGKRLLQMLKIILTGDFLERRINYSEELFVKLINEHKNGMLDKSNKL